MLNLNSSEWMELRRAAEVAQDTLLGYAIREQFTVWLAEATTVLTNPKTPAPLLRAAQGQYLAYKRGMMILEGLLRQASTAAERARKSKENPHD